MENSVFFSTNYSFTLEIEDLFKKIVYKLSEFLGDTARH